MSEQANRTYHSPLRDSQTQQTRDLILDALTEQLSRQRADEVSTREIAEAAGVSQPTVYRHFPDRQALLEGLVDRMSHVVGAEGLGTIPETIDDLGTFAARFLARTDDHAVEATAEAILNADPRRFSQATRAHSDVLLGVVAESLPQFQHRDHLRIAALLRCLFSVQTWLRMREEFGIPGTESGPVVAWAIETLVREIRAGRFPTFPARAEE